MTEWKEAVNQWIAIGECIKYDKVLNNSRWFDVPLKSIYQSTKFSVTDKLQHEVNFLSELYLPCQC